MNPLTLDPVRGFMVEELQVVEKYLKRFNTNMDMDFLCTCEWECFCFWYKYYIDRYNELKEIARAHKETSQMLYEDCLSEYNNMDLLEPFDPITRMLTY